MRVIGISGKIGSGKNYLAEKLIAELYRRGLTTTDASFAEPLKNELTKIINTIRNHSNISTSDLALHVSDKYSMELDDAKYMVSLLAAEAVRNQELNAYSRTENIRRALQYLGTDIRRKQDPDYWVRSFHENLPQNVDYIFATDVRFPNEADSIKVRGGVVIRIEVDEEIIAMRTSARDGLQYSETAKAHPSEIVMDSYENFDIIVHSTFDESEIVDKIISLQM